MTAFARQLSPQLQQVGFIGAIETQRQGFMRLAEAFFKLPLFLVNMLIFRL